MDIKAKLLYTVTEYGNRVYKIKKDDGTTRSLSSVTTILSILDKPALVGWKINKAIDYIKESLINECQEKPFNSTDATIERIFQDAKVEHKKFSKKIMDIGTMVHNLIEDYFKTGTIPLTFDNEQVKNGFNAFLDWQKKNNFQYLESETFIYNEEHEYAGRIDVIGMLNGKKYLIDFKTSNDFYFEYNLQVAGYTHAMNQFFTSEEKIKGMGILRLDKTTGLPHFLNITKNAREYLDMFLSLCNYVKLKKRIEQNDEKEAQEKTS